MMKQTSLLKWPGIGKKNGVNGHSNGNPKWIHQSEAL